MNSYKYTATDGRTIFSPSPLDYALTTQHTVDVKKLTASDEKKISIIASDYMAEIFTAADSPEKQSVWQQEHPAQANTAWYLHNYCMLVGDKVHIRDGKEYKNLSSFMRKASEDELKYILTQVALQAALCRAELLSQTTDVVAG